MAFEEFNPQIPPELDTFNDLHLDSLQNTTIDRNLQFEILMVRLSTILRIIIEDYKTDFSIASRRACHQINNSKTDLKGQLFESINYDSHFLTKSGYMTKERRQIKNILSKFLNRFKTNTNSINGSINDFDLQEIDDELLWLVEEYYRLSSLPNLTDNDTNRMLLILELAQFDPQLDNFINEIDAAIAEETGLTKKNSSRLGSTTKRFKEVFVKYLERKLSE